MPKPTLYKPEFADMVNGYIETTGREQTELPTVEGFSRFLGFFRTTLYLWEKEHPEFADALEKIKCYQKEQLMNDGLYGGKEVNSTMAIFLLKVNHDMVEKSALDLTSDGKSIAPMITLDTKKDE